ncbi:hypothetical protein NA57DRAFT_60428 [Rhizodiscina lignyota]|uniref:Uncharacterized protein n=1 Tax=Rhizodiscina lignyota TaxID=1504668 RepID=A0A9P4I9T8_9PEZI|nr:hypothetical protein NA57DRAFT_60428 [Rhizodiscina lignyota]
MTTRIGSPKAPWSFPPRFEIASLAVLLGGKKEDKKRPYMRDPMPPALLQTYPIVREEASKMYFTRNEFYTPCINWDMMPAIEWVEKMEFITFVHVSIDELQGTGFGILQERLKVELKWAIGKRVLDTAADLLHIWSLCLCMLSRMCLNTAAQETAEELKGVSERFMNMSRTPSSFE